MQRNQRGDGEEGGADITGLYSLTAFKDEIVFAWAVFEMPAYPNLY
ncbi:hypothetical protein RvVAR031_pl03600 (plasmid) [Agrobacterium vitis]|nr:hypothetical protein RvVAR031_pl03600 [Agrobacterium vitis]